jgi:hypothetical protein
MWLNVYIQLISSDFIFSYSVLLLLSLYTKCKLIRKSVLITPNLMQILKFRFLTLYVTYSPSFTTVKKNPKFKTTKKINLIFQK